ncbi:hypothetical protein F8271_19435 [Micromonospora sp. ALFpr18c]|uniref:Gmad2 immunoglobulin-like domain-containing protein n=1 Tax=unclassified Micromonospora TaxID=2617518 RepID=UPI00124AF72C|nr:Gmad2 immunoglobulin-like domain-containing protein [Micromonospora sp. ALFpr18c]KAB1937299.1 hypothetical protein F8271_19435 [Micromonospora sp. ALFpr18c]
MAGRAVPPGRLRRRLTIAFVLVAGVSAGLLAGGTVTQFPTVRQVRFDGGAPLGRASYTDLLPPIVVTGPVPGDRVSAPLTVTGTADVFEATVSVRALDAAGREVASGFGTAGCGSGCRGGYRVVVGWRTTREQRGTVEVYEVSARDGSRINTVAVPVVLAPGP